jgi:MFS transporter, DHA2 family, multidrug resistance protein
METNSHTGTANEARPILGIFAVLMGASLATFFGRLLSVGISDIRGALGIDFDSASWIGTSYNMGMMFIGPFSVYLGGLLGPRRVLLGAAYIFTADCLVMPFSGHVNVLIGLLVLAGLTAGTFYPLTLSFILRNLPQQYLHLGIAAYAIDIVVTTHVAHSYEGWIFNTLSWQWLFWTISALAPIMIALVLYGIPKQPLPQPKPGQESPSWRGFFYASLGAALLYGALDQGQRLDWWRSGAFVAMFVSGSFLVVVAAIRHFTFSSSLEYGPAWPHCHDVPFCLAGHCGSRAQLPGNNPELPSRADRTSPAVASHPPVARRRACRLFPWQDRCADHSCDGLRTRSGRLSDEFSDHHTLVRQ